MTRALDTGIAQIRALAPKWALQQCECQGAIALRAFADGRLGDGLHYLAAMERACALDEALTDTAAAVNAGLLEPAALETTRRQERAAKLVLIAVRQARTLAVAGRHAEIVTPPLPRPGQPVREAWAMRGQREIAA
jgi:hypothetical protein